MGAKRGRRGTGGKGARVQGCKGGREGVREGVDVTGAGWFAAIFSVFLFFLLFSPLLPLLSPPRYLLYLTMSDKLTRIGKREKEREIERERQRDGWQSDP
jgi:uncharacterized membrane protein